jgi:RimJ/RimL family protein N-acetyltransferase
MIEIKTERLILKKPDHIDKTRLVSLLGDIKVSGTLCNVPHPYTADDADEWLASIASREFELFIFLENDLVGGVGLTSRDHGFYELGYWLGVDYWGQGYTSEAVGGLLDYMKTNTPYKKFKAGVHQGNRASARILEKHGFEKVGESEEFTLSRQKYLPGVNYEYHFRD